MSSFCFTCVTTTKDDGLLLVSYLNSNLFSGNTIDLNPVEKSNWKELFSMLKTNSTTLLLFFIIREFIAFE